MLNKTASRLTFSGHDSFQCRQLWLKKGYDYIQEGMRFNDDFAVVKLGVGKNMVSSIKFWMKAFNIIDDKDNPTEFGIRLFDEKNGYDPYLEDETSLWLLHYQLVKTGFSSIYSIIYNEFRKEKMFFNKEAFLRYIDIIEESSQGLKLNKNTIGRDFDVFINLYKNDTKNKSIEDSFAGILSELELLSSTGKGKEELYYVENLERDNLTEAVILFSILDNPNYGNSISLNSLEFDFNSPGSIFALNRSGLFTKISNIVNKNKEMTFTDQAGIKELQFKNKPNAYSILDTYYGK